MSLFPLPLTMSDLSYRTTFPSPIAGISQAPIMKVLKH